MINKLERSLASVNLVGRFVKINFDKNSVHIYD